MKCVRYSLLGASLVASLVSLPPPALSTTTDSQHRSAVSSRLDDDYDKGYRAGMRDGTMKGSYNARVCMYRPTGPSQGMGKYAMGYRAGYRNGFISAYRQHGKRCRQ